MGAKGARGAKGTRSAKGAKGAKSACASVCVRGAKGAKSGEGVKRLHTCTGIGNRQMVLLKQIMLSGRQMCASLCKRR